MVSEIFATSLEDTRVIKHLFGSGLLADSMLKTLCVDVPEGTEPMIQPFSEKLTEKGKISHGLSSFGYDACVGSTFKICRKLKWYQKIYHSILGRWLILDPKRSNNDAFETVETDSFIIMPPHSFVLCHTKETFHIPEDVLSICLAKSTYARLGVIVGVTPLEPGWCGQVTIELSNTSDLPVKIYAHEGICQFLFFKGTQAPLVPYNKRGGKYMHQKGVVLPRILRG